MRQSTIDQGQDPKKYWILLAVGVGTFMSALDGSVVNTILPVVQQAFKSNIATVEWAVTIYLLVVSGLLLTFGRLGDMRGHKMMYVAGFAIFVASSALCGLAGSPEILIIFRAVQASGAAMLYANSPAILTKTFPANERGRALGLQATMTYLGLTVGPSLGGFLAEKFSWRAVFYINVPVGLIAMLLSLYFIRKDQGEETGVRFDLPGALLFMSGLIALLLGLNQGQEWGWKSFPILGLFGLAAVLLAAFVYRENEVNNPMLDLSLFKQRIFSAATSSAVFNYVVLYSTLFLMPYYLIQGRGLDPAQAGLLLTAQPLVMAISAPISGALSDKIGSRLPATLGMFILGIGMFLLSHLGPNTSQGFIVLGLAVSGLGTGIFISPNTSALMGAAPRNRQGIASGVLATARNMGMALGVGLAGAILTTIMAGSSSSALYEGVNIGFYMAMGMALLSCLASAVRGNDNKDLIVTPSGPDRGQ
jgi:EmrB/QacA subfamily drug resistance transporter